MIQPARIRILNERPVDAKGDYVLYWMQASQRTRFNHALEFAIERALELHKPLLVGFGLTPHYPGANQRHYVFMLEGLRDVQANLAARNILFVIRKGEPNEVALTLAKRAKLLVCDRGYTRHQKRWRDLVADGAGCQVVQVETDVVVPVEEVSDKAEFAARTIRPRIHRLWEKYLVPLKSRPMPGSPTITGVKSDVLLADVKRTVSGLPIDPSVKPSPRFTGGETAAGELLGNFIRERFNGYSEKRNEPSSHATTTLSGYLHFGQVSPLEIALAAHGAKDVPADDRDSLLEELIVRASWR